MQAPLSNMPVKVSVGSLLQPMLDEGVKETVSEGDTAGSSGGTTEAGSEGTIEAGSSGATESGSAGTGAVPVKRRSVVKMDKNSIKFNEYKASQVFVLLTYLSMIEFPMFLFWLADILLQSN